MRRHSSFPFPVTVPAPSSPPHAGTRTVRSASRIAELSNERECSLHALVSEPACTVMVTLRAVGVEVVAASAAEAAAAVAEAAYFVAGGVVNRTRALCMVYGSAGAGA